MRVLILGANGMLGHALVGAFAGEDIIAWTRADLNITDADAVRRRIRSIAPTCIVNAMAYNAVDRAETESEEANAVNGTAVGSLAAAAADVGAAFIHYSSDYVFDGASTTGYAEDDAPNPISAYGRSKLLGERMLADVARASPGWPWYCVRTSRLFGKPGTSTNAKRSFVDTMVALAATRGRIEVVDAEVSSPTYAPDLARAIRALVCGDNIGSASVGAPSGVYHRTNNGACTWYAFAQEIFRITGWQGTLVSVPGSALPRPAPRPACSILLTTKLPALRLWSDALAEYLASR